MAKKVLADLDFNNWSRILNLPDPVNAQDAVTKAYTDRAIEGLNFKDSARVATTATINLTSPGATIDGITLASGDRVLVKDHAPAALNGIYIWNGAAVAMTRALDANTANELEAAVVTVEEGTSAGATYRQTAVNFTLDSGAVAFTTFGTSAGAASETTSGIAEIATQAETDTGTDDLRFVTPLKLTNFAGKAKRYAVSIGDGSATSYVVTHNLGTKDVIVNTFYNASTFDEVFCDVQHTTTNTVTLIFAVAPASNAIRVVVIG